MVQHAVVCPNAAAAAAATLIRTLYTKARPTASASVSASASASSTTAIRAYSQKVSCSDNSSTIYRRGPIRNPQPQWYHCRPSRSSHRLASVSASAITSAITATTTTTTTTTTSIPRTRSFSTSFPEGVYPIVVTPFQDNAVESLDLDSFRRCIDFFATTSSSSTSSSTLLCQGVTIIGVLGESNRLTDHEREQLIQVAKDSIGDGGAPSFHLCVGTSHSGTAATVALSQMAQELGATSVMIAPTKSSSDANAAPPSDNDIVTLYRRVYEACGPDLQIVLQDHPSSTGVYLSLELMVRIVQEVPSVTCIKLESLPTVQRLAGLSQLLQPQHTTKSNTAVVHSTTSPTTSTTTPTPTPTILTGLGALYAGFDLEQQQGGGGAADGSSSSGFMTGFAFPEVLQAMHYYAKKKRYDLAHQVYRTFLPLIVLEQQPGAGLAVRKELYKLRGLIQSSHIRHPGTNLSSTLRQTLHMELQRCLPHDVDLTKPLPRECLYWDE